MNSSPAQTNPFIKVETPPQPPKQPSPAAPKAPSDLEIADIYHVALNMTSLQTEDIPASLKDRVSQGNNFLISFPEAMYINYAAPRMLGILAVNAQNKGKDPLSQLIFFLGCSDTEQTNFNKFLQEGKVVKIFNPEDTNLRTLIENLWKKTRAHVDVTTQKDSPSEYLLERRSQQTADEYTKSFAKSRNYGRCFTEREGKFLLAITQAANATLINNYKTKSVSTLPKIEGSEGLEDLKIVSEADEAVCNAAYPILDLITKFLADDEAVKSTSKNSSSYGWKGFNTSKPDLIAGVLEIKTGEIAKLMVEIIKENGLKCFVQYGQIPHERNLVVVFEKSALMSQEENKKYREMAEKAGQKIGNSEFFPKVGILSEKTH